MSKPGPQGEGATTGESPPTDQAARKTKAESPDYQKLFNDLVARANRGDPEALARLRYFLDRNPCIWERAGDLAAIAEREWTELIAGKDRLLAESVKRRVARMKADLAGEHPSAVESILIDQIAACYLAAQHAEIQASSPATGSLQQAAFRLKRAESSQKRLLAATKTLATLRALVPRGLFPVNPLKVFAPDQETA